MTDRKNISRVTGKQVLCDAVALLRDTSLYIVGLGKTVYFKLKNMLADEKQKDGASD